MRERQINRKILNIRSAWVVLTHIHRLKILNALHDMYKRHF